MKIFSYRYLPMNVYLLYSFFVLGSLFMGPIKYKDIDYFVLIGYVGAILLLCVVGFIQGAHGEMFVNRDYLGVRKLSFEKKKFLFTTILIFAGVSALVHWYSFISSGGVLSLGGIGDSYVKGYDGYERGQASIDFLYISNILDQAVLLLCLLCFIYYFPVLQGRVKLLFVFVALSYLLVNVLGAGKQKYLGDVVIFIFYGQAINFAARKKRFTPSFFLLVGALSVLVFFLFVEILRQRYVAAGINLDNIYQKTHHLIEWQQGSFFVDLVGADYAVPLGIFLGYFTNGLYGLYLSLTLSFDWTFMFGNSYSLGRIVEIALGINGAILEHTYPYRVGEEYGWGFDKWHSLFAWLASDLTFFGVLLVAPLFGFFYARLWLQAIRSSNPFSGPLFIYFSFGLIFSFANNQLMHSLAGVIVLVVLTLGWVVSEHSFIRLLNGQKKPGSLHRDY